MGSSTSIEVRIICQKILRHTVLDIYYLIMEEKDITKKVIAERFKEYDPDPDAKLTKYRNMIDVGISKLEGALFIDSWPNGLYECYYLTPYGEAAREIVKDMVIEDPSILNGSKITKRIMEESK